MWIICAQAFEGITFKSREQAVETARMYGFGPWRVTVNFRK